MLVRVIARTLPTASNPLIGEYLECWQPVDPTEYQNEWIGDVVSARPVCCAALSRRV